MFYDIRNLDHEFQCKCVLRFKVPGVRSSIPVMNISERNDRVIGKGC